MVHVFSIVRINDKKSTPKKSKNSNLPFRTIQTAQQLAHTLLTDSFPAHLIILVRVFKKSFDQDCTQIDLNA